MQNLSSRKGFLVFLYSKPFSIWKLASILICLFQLTGYASEFNPTASDDLLDQLKTAENDSLKAEVLMKLSIEQYYVNTDEAIRYANLALQSFSRENNLQGIGRCNNILGVSYFAKGEYNRAELFYNKALDISSEIGDTLYIGKSLNNLGNVHQKLGNLGKSIEFYIRSISLYQYTNNLNGEIGVTNNIAGIFRTVGNLDKAVEYYNRGLKIAEQLEDKVQQSAMYHNLSAIYTEQGFYSEALEACSSSYNIRKEIDYTSGVIKNLIAFGNIYSGMNEFDKASSYYEDALKKSRVSGYLDEEAYILLHLGYMKLFDENFKQARNYFTKGLSIADSAQDMYLQQDFHQYLYIVDSTTGNYQSALAHLQNYNKLKSVNTGFNLEERISELQLKYDLTRQENIVQGAALKRNRIFSVCLMVSILCVAFLSVIIVQQQRLKSRKKISELSQESLKSQMNPHFIFNVLNSIHAYILTNDKHASSEYLLKFAKLLRLTLDNSRAKLTTINDELEALRLYLDLESMRFENELEYDIVVDDEIDPYMFKIPPLLIQPYVENSIIHGLQNKEGKGKIEIQLNYEDNHIHCSIADNGVGRSKAMEIKKENNIKHKSHGSKITENRLKLLNSFYGKTMNMSYSDLLDEENHPTGTKVEFNLPILS